MKNKVASYVFNPYLYILNQSNMTTITNLTPTSQVHPAVGRIFMIELSNGESFQTDADALMGTYCYDATKPIGQGFDDEKAHRMVETNFQELIGNIWRSE
jgi:hypothetical protein